MGRLARSASISATYLTNRRREGERVTSNETTALAHGTGGYGPRQIKKPKALRDRDSLDTVGAAAAEARTGSGRR